MSCDLGVDTDQIRRAAVLLREAAEAIARQPTHPGAEAMSEQAAGADAEGRQALRLAITRTEQSAESAGDLRNLAEALADLLAHTAALFDQAEMLCGAGG